MKIRVCMLLLCLLLAIAMPAAAQYQIEGENILTSSDWQLAPAALGPPPVPSELTQANMSDQFAIGGKGLEIQDNLTAGVTSVDAAKWWIKTTAAGTFPNGTATAVVRIKTTSSVPFNALSSPPKAPNIWSRNVILLFSRDTAVNKRWGVALAIRPDKAAVVNNTGSTVYGGEVLGDNTAFTTWTIVARNKGCTFDLYRNGTKVIDNVTHNSQSETGLALDSTGYDGLALASAPNTATGSWIVDRVAYKAGEDPTWNPWPDINTATFQGSVYDALDTTKKIAGATINIEGFSGTTDENGMFTIKMAPEIYQNAIITVSAPGYHTKKYTKQAFEMVDGQVTSKSFYLIPLPTVTATVYDNFGERFTLDNTQDENHFPWIATGEIDAVDVNGLPYAALMFEQLWMNSGKPGSGVSVGLPFQPADFDMSVNINSIVGGNWAAIAYRQKNPQTYDNLNGQLAEEAGYLVFCPPDGSAIYLWRNRELARYTPPAPLTWAGGTPYTIRIKVSGSNHEIYLNGTKIITCSNAEKLSGGYLTLIRYNSEAVYDDLNVTQYEQQLSPTITGTVYNAANPSQKIAKALVISSDGTTVFTDNNGAYSISRANYDALTLTVKAGGYTNKIIAIDTPLPGVNTVDAAMTANPDAFATIGAAKAAGAGTKVELADKIVTGFWNGTTMYIEEPDRSAGIKVIVPPDWVLSWRTGQYVNVRGNLLADAKTGELYINTTEWFETANTGRNPLKPVFMNCQTLNSASGADVTGMSVKAVGNVTFSDATAKVFTMNDGGGDVKVVVDPGLTMDKWPAVGDYVWVHGIASLEGDTPETSIRVLRPWISNTNLLAAANPGCETELGFQWLWIAHNGCQATVEFSTVNPRSGNSCLKFTNPTPEAPNVYATMARWDNGTIPYITYELSAWVRATSALPRIHFTDWNYYTLYLPEGTYDWTRYAVQFFTPQTGLETRFNLTNIVTEMAMDDLAIRPITGTVTIIKPAGQ